MKILSNKKSIVTESIFLGILFSILMMIIPGITFGIIITNIFNNIIANIILISIFIIIVVFISIFLTKKNYKKIYKTKYWQIMIDKYSFTYQSTFIGGSFQVDDKIQLIDVETIKYLKYMNNTKTLEFKMTDGTTKYIGGLSNKIINSIAKKISKPITYYKEPSTRFKSYFKELGSSFSSLISENKKEILGSIIGLFLSVGSIVSYVYFKHFIWLTVIASIVTFGYGFIHLYYVYISRNNIFNIKIPKISFTLIVTILYHLIVFGLILLIACVGLKQAFSIDYLIYTIYSYPSIIIVIFAIIIGLFIIMEGG